MNAKTVFRAHAKTFSFAARLLPQTTHAHASELYAFCRYCDDLADDAKAKLITNMTKYKLEHVFKMEAEKNRNMERMEELAIKKLKVQNKYKLKKLENRK